MRTSGTIGYALPVSPEGAEHHAARLREALARHATRFAVDGWELVGVTVDYLMKRHFPVVSYRNEERTLSFLVTDDPADRAFRRGRVYGVSYFSYDVPDDQQARIFARDREQVERVAGWLAGLE